MPCGLRRAIYSRFSTLLLHSLFTVVQAVVLVQVVTTIDHSLVFPVNLVFFRADQLF